MLADDAAHLNPDRRRCPARSTESRSSASSDRIVSRPPRRQDRSRPEGADQDARRSFDGLYARRARVCRAIAEDPEKVWSLTIKQHTVAVVTDGSAVLGLGNIGPEAALPVMEGKAVLFKEFGGVDAFPICLATTDDDEIVATVKAIAPVFGGINLEDIAAPRCFEIEERLRAELDIPVFHDDQHGTAVVVLAARLTPSDWSASVWTFSGSSSTGCGAAGIAITKIMLGAGGAESSGRRARRVYRDRADINAGRESTPSNEPGLRARLARRGRSRGADVFIGALRPGRDHRTAPRGWPPIRSSSPWRTRRRKSTRRRSRFSPP